MNSYTFLRCIHTYTCIKLTMRTCVVKFSVTYFYGRADVLIFFNNRSYKWILLNYNRYTTYRYFIGIKLNN